MMKLLNMGLRRLAAFAFLGGLGATALGACGTKTVATSTSSSTGSGGSTGTGGQGNPCVGGLIVNGVCEAKCDPKDCLANNVCVGNKCALQCKSELDCLPDGSQNCAAAKEDGTSAPVNVCVANNVMPPGVGMACPFGTECKAPLVCLGAGPDDATAYCSKEDCNTNADCPGGYYCGVNRATNPICDVMVHGAPKGGPPYCAPMGDTSPCIASADFKKDGHTYFEGSVCLLRNVCKKSAQCAPCTDDIDCTLVPGQHCTTVGADKRCTSDCKSDTDCRLDAKCTLGECVPRAGTCKGTGAYCDPCLSDADCGDKTTQKICAGLGDGQRACLDLSTVNGPCKSDNDCPASPDGNHAPCYDANYCVSAADQGFDTCLTWPVKIIQTGFCAQGAQPSTKNSCW